MTDTGMMKQKPSGVVRFFRAVFRFFISLILLALLACAGLVALYAYIAAIAPPLSEDLVSPHTFRSSVRDDAGQEILYIAGEESNRVYIRLDAIPKHLRDAFIAIEDERFYSHPGVDLQGIARALVKNIAAGSLAQGASTITQQLIKNNVFSGVPETTPLEKIERKLQEQYLAFALERRHDKNWILEKYLNTINLGAGTWGVQTAAQRYFSKDASELTLSESAVIAAITRNPTVYNPLKHPEKNRERQLLVLSQMLNAGFLTQEQYNAAVQEDPYLNLKEGSWDAEIPIFSWFDDAALTQVVRDLSDKFRITESDAWDMLYHDGLTIETTQNTKLQEICEQEVNNISGDSDFQATVVLIDPSTGAVKAIVGGRGEKQASLVWNRAISSPRQPGSTFKIAGEFAVALDDGIDTLGTIYDDAPTSYTGGSAIRNASGQFQGHMTVRAAITQSINTVALRCFQKVGVRRVWDQLNKFGFRHLDLDQDYTEALALGGTFGGVTNLELTAAYAAIANGGQYTEPYYYTRVLDIDGNVLLEKNPIWNRVLSVNTATLLTSAMESVMWEGTGVDARFPGPALAGKSGTTSDRKDLWFIGYSTACVCGVWNGYDNPKYQEDSAVAKAMWKAVMTRVNEILPGRAEFSGGDDLEWARICTKCGKLAVDGLCNHTIQGDMTHMEIFSPGFAPVEYCDCHTTLRLCAESGELAGEECPEIYTQVYLKTGTPGTFDADAVVPALETCTIHQSWLDWSRSRGHDDSDSNSNGRPPRRSTPTPTPIPTPDDVFRWPWNDWF